ncbi:MAG: hypothetical protein RL528_440 [Bacteroidota bacterium]|jgi:hypothetical protein
MKMKITSTLVSLLLFTTTSYSQLDTLDLSKNKSFGSDTKALKAFSKQFNNGQTFKFVKDYEGNVYGIGDKFKLGIPQKIQGATTNTHFSCIYSLDPISSIIPLADIMSTLRLPGLGWVGAECTVIKIGVRKSFGFAISFIVFSSQGIEISTNSIDGSLHSKELIDPNAPMSSEEAITKLKAFKEKLDLGLITQEEYDSNKLELSKYIK